MKNIFYISFSILLLLSACSDIENNANTSTQAQEYPDQESWDAQMFFTKDGKRRAVLRAGYIAKYSNKKHTILKDSVKVDFYDENGEWKSVLTSREGKVFDDREDMIATGNVVVVSKNGTTLYSEELLWKNAEEKIISQVAVKITTQSDTLYGDTFTSDPDLVNYEITNTHGKTKKTISIED